MHHRRSPSEDRKTRRIAVSGFDRARRRTRLACWEPALWRMALGTPSLGCCNMAVEWAPAPRVVGGGQTARPECSRGQAWIAGIA